MKYNGVFIPWIYDNTTSLEWQIEKCIDSSIQLTPQILANLIVKYIFTYIYPNEISSKISESDINEFYRQSLEYHSNYRWEKRPEISSFARLYAPYEYQMWMAWDIAATIPLLQSITSKNIETLIWEDIVNVEAGTWSGILQLARYIWAERNKSTIKVKNNIWIETSKDAAIRTSEILTKLRIWKVLYWDSTDVWFYSNNKIPQQIHFFTNENIPRYWTTLKQEPFVRNILTLLEHVWDENFEKIDLFPFYSKFQHKISEEIVVIFWWKKSLCSLKLLKSLQKDIENLEKNLISLGISFNQEKFYDDQWTIGDEFIVWISPQWFIHFQNWWYHRWKKK